MITRTYKIHRCRNCGYIMKILVRIADLAIRVIVTNKNTIISRCWKCDSAAVYPKPQENK